MRADSKQRIAIYIALAILVALVIFFVTNESPSRYKNKIIPDKDSVSNALLGSWEIVEKIESGKSVQPNFKETLGFVGSSKEGDMRVYWDTVESLYKIDKWKLEEQQGKSMLMLYRWHEWGKENSAPYKTWEVSYPETDSLVLINTETFDSQRYSRVRNAREEAAINFKRTQALEKEICSKIIKGENTVEDLILLPITCTTAISPEKGEIDLHFALDGSVRATFESKEIFSTDLDENMLSLPFLKAGVIKIADITYDGYEDIQILVSGGAYNYYYEFYRFNPEKFSFENTPFIDATNPRFDFNERSLMSLTLGRGLGDVFTKLLYVFRDNRYVPFEREIQTIIEDANPTQYERVIEHFVNNEWNLVLKQTLIEDQAFIY